MARRPALIKRKPKATRVSKSQEYLVNKKHLGDEPVFTKPLTRIEYIHSLNWYNYMSTSSEAKDYIVTYLKNLGRVAEAKKVKSIPDNLIPTTVAWCCRLLSRGFVLPVVDIQSYIDERIKQSYKYVQEIKEETPKNVVSIQDRIKERASFIVGEIEGLIDDYIYDNVEFSLYEWLQANSIPATYATSIISKFSPVLDELLETYEGNCEQLKEGYRHLKKAEIKKLIEFYNTLIEDAERYSSNTKKVRTARKPRTVSVEKKIKNLKYQKEDQTYKIASVSPERIIGAQELWTFNTKYKNIRYSVRSIGVGYKLKVVALQTLMNLVLLRDLLDEKIPTNLSSAYLRAENLFSAKSLMISRQRSLLRIVSTKTLSS